MVAESDARRARINYLVDKLGKGGDKEQGRAKKMDMMEELWKTIKAEGYKCLPEFGSSVSLNLLADMCN